MYIRVNGTTNCIHASRSAPAVQVQDDVQRIEMCSLIQMEMQITEEESRALETRNGRLPITTPCAAQSRER